MATQAYARIFSIILLLVGLLSLSPAEGATHKLLKCPEPAVILPCICESIFTAQIFTNVVTCQGDEVGQENVDNIFTQLRILNGYNTSQWMRVGEFTLSNTNLVQLDVTVMLYTIFDRFTVTSNPFLTTMAAPSVDIGEGPVIEVQSVILSFNDLAAGDLNDFFKLASTTVQYLTLTGSRVSGSNAEGQNEFLTGSSALSQLTELKLDSNVFTKLGGGQFRVHRELTVFNLQNNRITQLGDDAFLLDKSEYTAPMIVVYLLANDLNHIAISSKALTGMGRRSQIDFRNNFFEFISADNFKEYLDTVFFGGEQATLIFEGNHFVCDERMKWLKDGRESYEPRVSGVTCTNDPGETIFTTDLV